MRSNVIYRLTGWLAVAMTAVLINACAPSKKPAEARSPLDEGLHGYSRFLMLRRPAKKTRPRIRYAEPKRYRIDTVPILSSKPLDRMYFRYYGTNPTIDTTEENVSTFSTDPDTASYHITKAYLLHNKLPPEAAVRVEEFINAFDYNYPAPGQRDFSIYAEAFPSPTRPGYHVLHLGIKATRRHQRKPLNLVFVVDVSSSMDRKKRLQLIKKSLRLVVSQLRADDRLAIVSSANKAYTVLKPTSGRNKRLILQAIDNLKPGNTTNLQKGLLLGYRLLENRHSGKSRINQVVLLSNGATNKGALTSSTRIFSAISPQLRKDVRLTVVGTGLDHYNDVLLENLARKGDGNYIYIINLQDARSVLVKSLTDMARLVAKDMKIQVVFDKNQVSRFRLLGYENRVLKKNAFKNRHTDGGEVAAGRTVTAIYEIKFRSRRPTGRFATLKINYKKPGTDGIRLLNKSLNSSIVRRSFERTRPPTKLSYIVAVFAEKLRGSYWVRSARYKDLLRLRRHLPRRLAQSRPVLELYGLIKAVRATDRRTDKFESRFPLANMTFDHVPILR